MSLIAHPASARLARAIQRCRPLVAPWSGHVLRSTGYSYATRYDLPRGEGSRIYGGRWNSKGWATVYGSLDMATALAEMLAYYRHQGLPEIEATPTVWVGFHVRFQAVLDLRAACVRRELDVGLRRMKEEPWRTLQQAGEEALTQAIGRLARQAGVEALLVPSARKPGGTNVVMFPEARGPGSVVEIHMGHLLPARRRRQAP